MRDPLPAAAAQCACVLSLAIGVATCQSAPGSQTSEDRQRAGVSAMRIYSHPHTGDEKAAYTVRIDSPWPDGGQLHVNFPEHLEYGPVGYTITRYNDPRPPAWQVDPERKSAHYDVQSIPGRGVEGVKVRATARVVEPNRVRLSLTIANNSSKTLHDVKPGETKERIVNVIFAGADWRRVVDEIAKQRARQGSQQAGVNTERSE